MSIYFKGEKLKSNEDIVGYYCLDAKRNVCIQDENTLELHRVKPVSIREFTGILADNKEKIFDGDSLGVIVPEYFLDPCVKRGEIIPYDFKGNVVYFEGSWCLECNNYPVPCHFILAKIRECGKITVLKRSAC